MPFRKTLVHRELIAVQDERTAGGRDSVPLSRMKVCRSRLQMVIVGRLNRLIPGDLATPAPAAATG
jgi:hypothetical protein